MTLVKSDNVFVYNGAHSKDNVRYLRRVKFV